MKYIRLSIITTSEFSHIVADRLFDFGSLGTLILDPNDLKEVIEQKKYWDYIDPSAVSADPHTIVTGFFDEDTNMTKIVKAMDALKDNAYFDTGSLKVSYATEDSSDYENAWKQYYKPIEIGDITIVPKWIPFDTPNTTSVLLDPGAAFGTGSHETTALCVELLQVVPHIQGKKVLDMGCGSGVLGITALRLGAKSAAMVDIDPIATKAAHDNASLNGVDKKAEFITAGFGDAGAHLKPLYDIILANLTADMLIGFYPEVDALLGKNSYMVISGILFDRLDEVMAYYGKIFTAVKQKTQNNWCGLLLKKN